MGDDGELMERLVAASGAEESPIDREEHAARVAEVVERVRGVGVDIPDELLEQARKRRRS